MNKIRVSKKVYCFFISFIIFIYPSSIFGEASEKERELEPHYVVIESSFSDGGILPLIRTHSLDIKKPKDFKEPYFPDIQLSSPLLFEKFPRLTKISQLTKSLGFFSEYFIDDRGALENAILLARGGKFEEASKKFYKLRVDSTEYQEIATLWLSWIKFKEKNWEQSTNYSVSLHNARDQKILKETYYLSSLLLIKNEKYDEIKILLEELIKKIGKEKIDFRLNYIYLISLIKTEKWQLARNIIDPLKQSKIQHVPQYYHIEEMDGIISYYQNDVNIGLTRYQLAYHYNVDPLYRQFIGKNMAWMLYFDKQYDQAVALIDRELSGFRKDEMQKLSYLKISSLVANNRWDQIEDLFSKLEKGGDFYQFSAYKIRVNLPQGEEFDLIRKQSMELQTDFDEMKFHYKILNGNQYVQEEKFDLAESEYLKAIAGHSKNRSLWIVKYNLGLLYLKTFQYDRAEEVFESLLNNREAKKTKWLYYHLIYSYYQQGKMGPLLNIFQLDELFEDVVVPEEELLWMKAGALQEKNMNREALEVYNYGWETFDKILFLEFATALQYKMGLYKKVLQIYKKNEDLKSTRLFELKIKALLALGNNSLALQEIEAMKFSDDEAIKIRLEVWLANELDQKIIEEVMSLLRNSSKDEKRLLYYLSLGDAYFNLNQFPKSKIQFYKALNVAKTREQKSLIIYNIVLTTYFYKDYPSYIKETNIALKNTDLTGSIRYILTQLYGDYLFSRNEFSETDRLLEGYIEKYSYQRAKANLKYLSLVSQSKRYVKCLNLAKIIIDEETDFQRRDRVILAIICANKIGDWDEAISFAQTELREKNFDFRKGELTLLLANALHENESYEESLKLLIGFRSKELSKNIQQQINILMAKNYLYLDQIEDAENELGEILEYRSTPQYIDAVILQGEIFVSTEAPEKAIRSFLRVFYHKKTSEQNRMLMLIQISELYLDQGKIADANLYFDKIDFILIGRYPELKRRYDEIKGVF